MARSASLGTSVPALAVVNGVPTTTSLDVARHFHKRHDNVVQSIERLLPQLPESARLNFQVSEYADATGRALPMYRLTRDGFTLLAMGFTGARALEFKLAYLNAFNQMEAELEHSALPALDPASCAARRLMLTGAAQLGAEVQAEAMTQLARDEWLESGRWLLSFVSDEYRPGQRRPRVRRIEAGTYIGTFQQLTNDISNPASMLSADELAGLARACLGELERRAAYARQLEIAAHRAKVKQ